MPAGSFTALLGTVRSGKTTLLRLLAGFETTRPGDDRDRRADRRRERHPRPPRATPDRLRPAGGQPLSPPHRRRQRRVRAAPRRRDADGVDDLLELVGLGGLGRRYPHQLSGGQQQRVALARALAVKPEVVLLDEPFASLDAHLRAGVREEVRRILGERGTTTLLVTHDQDEALSVADLVAVLRDGQIVQHATPRDLYAGPVDCELAAFVGDANLIDGVARRGARRHTARQAPGPLARRAADHPGRVTVLIRPEQIAVCTAARESGPVGRVVRCGYHGHDTVLQVQLGCDRDGPLVLVRTLGNAQLAPGDSVGLSARGAVLVWPTAPRR